MMYAPVSTCHKNVGFHYYLYHYDHHANMKNMTYNRPLCLATLKTQDTDESTGTGSGCNSHYPNAMVQFF